MSLSKHIEEDLTSQLQRGQIPCKMSIAALSEYYQSSSTPIRAVVANLLERDLLKKLPNGRLEAINSPQLGTRSRKSKAGFLKNTYEDVLRDIVQLSLRNSEEFIREEAGAKRYDISRSAMREHLLQLAGQGLLEHIPRRGWRVRPFTQKDLNNYCEVREVMELKALELAWDQMVDCDLKEILEGNIASTSSDKHPKIDNRLHDYLVEKSDNFYIKDFFNRHKAFFKILFEWEGEDRDAANQAVEQHHEILNALLKRDKKMARKALINHIHHNHPVLKNLEISKLGTL
ncbi:GntR family transcriptional regulator [Lentisphaera marina]|uniref:GntR family transcriptional regulator n=1 Tax=Lentisphaera marina TaxID=1111041 RepID=UPI0023655BA9|nr:GntR family transcriptional regulator [Lentisphaera marina]MDD7983921.1 GntR family transcriptional regulator [Lentisphaera marina]